MRKRETAVLLGILMLSLVACGDNKKIDTDKVEINNNQEEVVIAPYVEDGCITVVDLEARIDRSGTESAERQWNYNEDGSIKSLTAFHQPGDIVDLEDKEYICNYNEFGYPCELVNGEEYYYFTPTDRNGFTIAPSSVNDYTVDEEGNFKTCSLSSSTNMEYVYENGLIKTIITKRDDEDERDEYTYIGDKSVSIYTKSTNKESGKLSHESTRTIKGDGYEWENVSYDWATGVKSSAFKIEVDERGVYLSYDEEMLGIAEEHYICEYNDDKTLYTMKNPSTGSVVKGYQIKFTEDGRPISVYKIGEDGNRVSDDDLCTFMYDSYGHLTEAIVRHFKGTSYEADYQAWADHIFFKRVPKDTYKDSIFYQYYNIPNYENLFFLNGLRDETLFVD